LIGFAVSTNKSRSTTVSYRFHAAAFFGLIALAASLAQGNAKADPVRITKVEATPLFPKAEPGQSQPQIVRVTFENPGPAIDATLQFALPGTPASDQSLGSLPTGASTRDLKVPEIKDPTEIRLSLLSESSPLAAPAADVKKVMLQPQRKWKIYCVSYSHHDLGFGNYPHRLRTDIRHANIERPLQFCRETDAWDADSRFRYVIETSEPITSFLATHSEADAAELARRIREGRIQVGGVHSTVNTEQLGHEALARLFYLSNRHTCDLLNVPPSKTGQIDDVVGLTWPLATMCHEAGLPYFFHGHNGCAECFRPASNDAVFYWQGPGGDPNARVLVHTRPYGTNWDSINETDEPAISRIIAIANQLHWPYQTLISQDGTDFQLITLDNATKIHNWNAKWAYPRLICATMDMFFDAIAAEADSAKLKAFAKDGNNQWADQDSAAARVLAQARKQGELIPTAEKFATIASVLAGGEYPWTDIYQAYHRLLLYHEHTDGIDNAYDPSRATADRVETEQAEMREMAADAQFFGDRARTAALDRLAALIATKCEKTIVVFNPLSHTRTDLVRIHEADVGRDFYLEDTATHKVVPVEHDGDELVFIASDVPSLGHKSFAVVATPEPNGRSPAAMTDGSSTLDNRFYRARFDTATGAITSILDKKLNVELVDQAAPEKFNEYLYERYETPDIKAGSKWYRAEKAEMQGSVGPVSARMTVRPSAFGARDIMQTVTIYNDLKRIDFTLEFDKSPSGRDARALATGVMNKESVYVALPWQVPDFNIRHEVPGAVEEPVKDLFDGACTAYYAVRHFSDVSGPRYGVTVSSPENSLVEYGRPRSCPNPLTSGTPYEMEMKPPANSRMYLYLMNNAFDTNIPLSQTGPARFTYSIRSHEGDWKAGRADQFGWETLNPLLVKIVTGKQDGPLPETSSIFLTIDKPNVVCTAVKPAEANGRGIVLRFVETQGQATTAKFKPAFLGTIGQAVETNLLEEDRGAIPVGSDGEVEIALAPFGVKTVRLLSRPVALAAPTALAAKPLSDKDISLSWQAPVAPREQLGYYRIYRGATPDFKPGLLNLVARSSDASVVDRPALHFGGWINNRVEPETTYYYRVAWVDRWNNESPASDAVKATTLKSSEVCAKPNPVECLSAILVSPLDQIEHVTLLFRTNCESDVVGYEIHRSTARGFTPDNSTLLDTLDANAIIPGSPAYGHTPVDRRMKEFDHLMYQDDGAAGSSEYFYRVRAVNSAGRKGPFSNEASVKLSDRAPQINWTRRITAQSIYAPEYGKLLAIDGSPDPYRAWISRPYGGGTKENPRDAFWAIEFPGKTLTLKGVRIVGDHRDVIPLQKNMQVQLQRAGKWETAAEIRDAAEKDITAQFKQPLECTGIRILVPAADLPYSDRADVDGIVRICELLVILPDRREVPATDWFQ
jgi:hypothetical protein